MITSLVQLPHDQGAWKAYWESVWARFILLQQEGDPEVRDVMKDGIQAALHECKQETYRNVGLTGLTDGGTRQLAKAILEYCADLEVLCANIAGDEPEGGRWWERSKELAKVERLIHLAAWDLNSLRGGFYTKPKGAENNVHHEREVIRRGEIILGESNGEAG